MVLRPRGRGRVGRRRHPFQNPRRACMAGVLRIRVFHYHRAHRHYRRPKEMSRAGIVTVVGKPNAGKSTLLNRVIGEKLSITSAKPQSTRDRIAGIHTRGDTQMVLLDTPGLLEPRYAL